jgi:hypothetical protein
LQAPAGIPPLVAGIGEQRLQEGIHPKQRRQHQDAAVAILDVSGVNNGMQEQAQRVYQNVALLALDLLARIIAMRIDAGPPFYALFHALAIDDSGGGLASCSACSRHAT